MAPRDPNEGRPPELRLVRDVRGVPPPHDLMAEQVLLSAVMLDRTAHDRIATIVEAAHFYSDAHGKIFQAALDLAGANQSVGLVEIAGKLRDKQQLNMVGGAAYLTELLDKVPVVADIEHAARRVRDLHRLRNLAAESARISAESYSPQVDVQAFLDHSEAALSAAAGAPAETTAAPLNDALRTTFAKLQDNLARGITLTGVSTKLTKLDALTGGLQDSELIVPAARPGQGKTAFGCELAVSVADTADANNVRRDEVLLFSMEMTKEQIAQRLICTHAKVDSNKLRSAPHLITAVEWSRLAGAAQWLGTLPIVIDDQRDLTPIQMRAKCRRAKAAVEARGGKLRLVLLDYLQLMNALPCMPDKRANREAQVSYVAKSLASLARELQLPIVALAQLNRAVEKQKDKRPQLSDLRESGMVEQAADTVIFIHREEYYLREETPEDLRNIAELIVGKQRNGPTGTARVRFEAKYTKFDNLAVEPGWSGPDPRSGPDD